MFCFKFNVLCGGRGARPWAWRWRAAARSNVAVLTVATCRPKPRVGLGSCDRGSDLQVDGRRCPGLTACSSLKSGRQYESARRDRWVRKGGGAACLPWYCVWRAVRAVKATRRGFPMGEVAPVGGPEVAPRLPAGMARYGYPPVIGAAGCLLGFLIPPPARRLWCLRRR